MNERQHLPSESRRRIGKWSRGVERVFEDVVKEGVRRGEFWGHLTYIDHGSGMQVKSTAVTGFEVDPANANNWVGEYTYGALYTTTDGGHSFSDYASFKREFRQLFGFEVPGIDYTQPAETEVPLA